MKIKEFIQQKFENAWQTQIDLQEEMQANGLNLVTCCNCDAVLIHKRTPITEKEQPIVCYSCMENVYPNDCEDYYYEGMSIGEVDMDMVLNNSNLISYLEEIDKIDSLDKGMSFQDRKSVFYLFVNDEKFSYDNEKNRNDDMERIEEFLLTIKK